MEDANFGVHQDYLTRGVGYDSECKHARTCAGKEQCTIKQQTRCSAKEYDKPKGGMGLSRWGEGLELVS